MLSFDVYTHQGGVVALGTKNLFIEKIQNRIDDGQFMAAMCVVPSMHSQVTCMAMLSYFLRVERKKGIYVSVVRPYYYLQRLLYRAGLPAENLVMLDAMKRPASNGSNVDPQSEGTEGDEMKTGLRTDLIDILRETLDNNLETSFLVLDNFSGLLPFLTEDRFVEMVKDISDLGKTRPSFKIVILMDSDTDPHMLERIEAIMDRKFEISPGFFK